jgi:voltage-gated potassium channel Kch
VSTTPRRIVVVGSGHLAHRVSALATADAGAVVRLAPEPRRSTSGAGTFGSLVQQLRDLDVMSATSVYLVDDLDEVNLEFLIALLSIDRQLPVVLSLFNENIAPHLQAANPHVRVVNPAKMAAPAFVAALDTPLTRTRPLAAPVTPGDTRRREPVDPLIQRLTLGFAVLLLAATAYFHAAEQLAWIDALYFVVVTVATVGYGDINLRDASTMSKLVGIGMIIGSTCFIWMIFSLTVDHIIKRRVQLALGRRVYTDHDHVVVCGLGRLGLFIAEQLMARGERVVIVERDEACATLDHLRALGADVYIGDARRPAVLQDVGVRRAKALYAVINNDFTNLEIGLNARTVRPDLRLVLRLFDDGMAARVREQLDIHLTLSMTAIADEPVYRAMPSVAAAAP